MGNKKEEYIKLIYKNFKDTVSEYNLINRDDRIILACSGGQDSLTLLLLLKEFSSSMPLKIIVGHINHRLRKEADKEEEFVREISESLGLEFYSCKLNPKTLKRDSLEQQARLARLEFFKELSFRTGFRKVATGHTQDDVIETMLMRILKGTGLRGLRAIQPLNNIEGLVFIRPLINISRKQTLKFVEYKDIRPCRDESNRDLRFLRNKIRLKLLPFLEKNFTPEVREHLFHLSLEAGRDYEFLEKASLRLLKRIAKTEKGRIEIPLKKFTRMEEALQAMLFRLSFSLLKGDLRGLEYKHFRDFKKIINSPSGNLFLNLPSGVYLFKTGERFVLSIKQRL